MTDFERTHFKGVFRDYQHDEAHHLKNEWQKALEKFISALDKEVKIISLTATPPYDSEGSEWY